MRYRLFPILHVMGMMLIFFSVTYAMPIVTSIIYDDGALFEFVDALAFVYWSASVYGGPLVTSNANCSRATVSCWSRWPGS